MTVNAILQAAAKVLEADGIGGFSTAKVADRAGVSIGTLYQYFGRKWDLLVIVVKAQVERALADVAALLAGRTARSPHSIVEALIEVFEGPRPVRVELCQALFGGVSGQDWTEETVRSLEQASDRGPATREAVFVLTSSLLGVLCAVLEEDSDYDRERLKAKIVLMIEAYVQRDLATA